jgi:hypothetical protein
MQSLLSNLNIDETEMLLQYEYNVNIICLSFSKEKIISKCPENRTEKSILIIKSLGFFTAFNCLKPLHFYYVLVKFKYTPNIKHLKIEVKVFNLFQWKVDINIIIQIIDTLVYVTANLS